MEDTRWDNPAHQPMSNGPIRTVTGPAEISLVLDSSRREMEYLLSFPFHAVDPNPWPPISVQWDGVPFTIYRPIGCVSVYATQVQMGNEQADAYCTVVRISSPLAFLWTAEDGWKLVKRLMEWIRVKCRHYWLLHGLAGFGATFRGTMFTRDNNFITQKNIALYGPNVIVNPISIDVWSTLAADLEDKVELPLEDALYCDSLLSVVAGDSMKALLEVGVAMEISLTKLLVDVSSASPSTPEKRKFIKVKGDRQPFGKKLSEWTRTLGLDPVDTFEFDGMPSKWNKTVHEVYKLRNGVVHAGTLAGGVSYHKVVDSMFAAGALLHYCRTQRLQQHLEAFRMPSNMTPWQHLRFCHDGSLRTETDVKSGIVQM